MPSCKEPGCEWRGVSCVFPGYMVLRMTIDAVTRRSERQTRFGMEAKSVSTFVFSAAEHKGAMSPRRAIMCSFMAARDTWRE